MGVKAIAKAALNTLTDSRFRYYYRQRRIENIERREQWAQRLSKTLPPAAQPATAEAERLGTDGILPLPGLITAEQVADMRAHFEAGRCSDPYRPALGSFRAPGGAPAETHVAYFDNETVAAAPHALSITNDTRILSAVGAVLGAQPTISYMAAWWSLPGRGGAEHAELFHRDYDDLRFVKLFVYLTDVDADSGPHAFIRGSHRTPKLMERRRFSTDEVGANYPPEDHLELSGPAGTAFLENTFGLHRGIPPRSRPRLIFQALYSLAPYIGGPRKPVDSAIARAGAASLDPYINRIYYQFA